MPKHIFLISLLFLFSCTNSKVENKSVTSTTQDSTVPIQVTILANLPDSLQPETILLENTPTPKTIHIPDKPITITINHKSGPHTLTLRPIEKIKASVKHLNDLLEDFLSLGKLDEGKIGAIATKFSLPEVVTETTEDIKGILKTGQQVYCEHEGDSVVLTDKKLIKNILINLISNAVKFSEENTAINIRSKVEDSTATISVQDQGIGISEEDQEHLFKAFHRGSNVGTRPGTGLGLLLAKRCADLHGGQLQLNSNLAEGTTVTVKLPVFGRNHENHIDH